MNEEIMTTTKLFTVMLLVLSLLLVTGGSTIAFAHTKQYKAGFKEGCTGGDPFSSGQVGAPTGIEHYNAGYDAGYGADQLEQLQHIQGLLV